MSKHFEFREMKAKWKTNIKKWLYPIMGLAALIWFFIRVIPKPSRATYPCQRAAFPIASSFVIWVTGIFSGAFILKKLKDKFASSRYIVVSLGVAAFIAAVLWNFQLMPSNIAAAYEPVKLPKSDVALIQSTKTDVKQIDYTEIKQMVTDAVNAVGGIDGVVKDGDSVVIKPNLIVTSGLSTEANGVTTDWRVTKAVVELVRSVNPSGKVYVMEGAISDTSKIFTYYKYTPQNIPGVDEFLAIEKDSGSWNQKNSTGLSLVSLSDGLLYKEYYLNRKYKEADVVINIPTMKQHWNAGFTGAVKNVGIGATPGNIYGISSNEPARNNMVNHNNDDLHKWIRDYYKCRKSDLVIMDGLQGYQNGPFPFSASGANGNQMNMRMILAGKDAVALDSIACLSIGWDPQSIGYLRYLNTDGVGNMDPSCINVIGKKVDQVRKYLQGTEPKNGGLKITDKTPPQLTIKSLEANNNRLKISMDASSETANKLVYIDGQLYEPSSVSDSTSGTIELDIGNLTKGNHEVTVEAYDRFLNRTEQKLQFNADTNISPTTNPSAGPTKIPTVSPAPEGSYYAPKASTAPSIDGIGNESCWESAVWKDIKYVWLGTAPTPDDFSGRFKLVWTPERLYYLVEITDEKLSSPNTTPLKGYYDNDCVEIFIDEDHSGGNHQNNYSAFAYHIQLNYDIIDNNTKGTQSFYNDHAKVMRTKNGNVYTWEIELKVFDDKYDENSTNNKPVTLTKDKELGFGVSYNDNDNKMTRDNFIGSMNIQGTDKNVAWINAGVFDTLKLVELTPPVLPTPTTPTVNKGDINGDGSIDSTDYALLKRFILKVIDRFSYVNGEKAADVNSDGVIDSIDYALMKRYLLNIINKF